MTTTKVIHESGIFTKEGASISDRDVQTGLAQGYIIPFLGGFTFKATIFVNDVKKRVTQTVSMDKFSDTWMTTVVLTSIDHI